METKKIKPKEPKQAIWVTAYLFTRGLIEAQGVVYKGYKDMLFVRDCQVIDGQSIPLLIVDKECFFTREEAVAQSKVLITRKLAALDKQRAEIEKLAQELNEQNEQASKNPKELKRVSNHE